MFHSDMNTILSMCINLHTHTHPCIPTHIPAQRENRLFSLFFFFLRKLRVNSSVQYQNKNEVASVIGHPVTQFCCSLIRWQDRWLIAQGRWYCTPNLCWCVGEMASHTPISTAASSLPWRSLRFWSLLSERGLGKYAFIWGFCYGGWHIDLDLGPSLQ